MSCIIIVSTIVTSCTAEQVETTNPTLTSDITATGGQNSQTPTTPPE